MTWHYQVRMRFIHGEPFFDIVEVYPDPLGWTKDSIAPCGESKEDVIQALKWMLNDARKHEVLNDIGPDCATQRGGYAAEE